MATAAQYARDGPGTAAKREALLAYLRVSQHTLKEASKTEYAANHYDELAAVGRSLERCVHNVVEGLTEGRGGARGGPAGRGQTRPPVGAQRAGGRAPARSLALPGPGPLTGPAGPPRPRQAPDSPARRSRQAGARGIYT